MPYREPGTDGGLQLRPRPERIRIGGEDVAPVGAGLNAGTVFGTSIPYDPLLYAQGGGKRYKPLSLQQARNTPIVVGIEGRLQAEYLTADLGAGQVNAKGEFEDGEHPAHEWLKRPNAEMDGITMQQAVLADAAILGSGYVVKGRERPGAPLNGLAWWPWRDVQPQRRQGSGRIVDHYRIRTSRGWIRAEVDDVIHVQRGADPLMPGRGRNILLAVRDAVTASWWRARRSASMLQHGAMGIMLMPVEGTPDLTDAQQKAGQAALSKRLEGSDPAEPIVMRRRWDAQPLGNRPSELAFEAQQLLLDADIATAFGIPPIILNEYLGVRYDAQRAGYGVALKQMVTGVMIPLWRELADAFTKGLMAEYPMLRGSWEFRYDWSKHPALAESEEARWNRILAGVKAGVITPQGAGAMLGVPEEHIAGE